MKHTVLVQLSPVSPHFAPKQDNVNGKQKSKSGLTIEKGKTGKK
jgi:hypothetical protein